MHQAFHCLFLIPLANNLFTWFNCIPVLQVTFPSTLSPAAVESLQKVLPPAPTTDFDGDEEEPMLEVRWQAVFFSLLSGFLFEKLTVVAFACLALSRGRASFALVVGTVGTLQGFPRGVMNSSRSADVQTCF